MFDWMFRWIGKKINQSNYCREMPKLEAVGNVQVSNNLDSGPKTLNLSIHPANGGIVLEFRSYNQKTDRSNQDLYVIPESADMTTTIASCIFQEYLKK